MEYKKEDMTEEEEQKYYNEQDRIRSQRIQEQNSDQNTNQILSEEDAEQFKLEQEEIDKQTKQSVIEMVELLNEPKYEVKKQTLMVILQFSTTKNSRKFFIDQPLVSHLLRNLQDDQLESICLSNLINFSIDEEFSEQMYQQNAIDRIVQNIKEIFQNIQENVAQGNKIIDKQTVMLCNLYFLVLTNLTKNPIGVMKFMRFDEPSHTGINFTVLFNLYLLKDYAPLTHQFGNSLANISAQEDGRKNMIESKDKILDKIYQQIFDNQKDRRFGSLKVLRNITFEYDNEKVKQNLLDENLSIINTLSKYLVIVLLMANLVKDQQDFQKLTDIQQNMNFEQKPFTQLSNPEEEIVTCLDIFLIMTNIPEIEQLVKYDVDQLLGLMLIIRKVVKPEFIDKVDVILMLFCKFNPE